MYNKLYDISHPSLFPLFLQELRLKFYQLMIDLDQHEGSFLQTCKHFRAVYETPMIKEDPLKKKEVQTDDFNAL